MSTTSPAFQFYPQDFLVGTAIFTAEQAGAYIRFLCYQWAHGGLPNDDDALARLAGCGGNAVASVRAKFEVGPDGLLRNRRLEEIREGQQAYRDRQARNAKNRWEKREKPTPADATASKRHRSGKKVAHATTDSKPMPNACSSSSSSSTPIVPKGDAPPDGENPPWDEDAECCRIIWEGHAKRPRERSSRKQVRAVWDKIPKSERPGYDALLASLTAWRTTKDWFREDGEYSPAAHLWVQRRKWEDTPKGEPRTAVPDDNSILGRTLKTSEFHV